MCQTKIPVCIELVERSGKRRSVFESFRICLKTVEAGKIERRPLPTSVHRLERTQSFREQESCF